VKTEHHRGALVRWHASAVGVRVCRT